jgi:hypothetical protein
MGPSSSEICTCCSASRTGQEAASYNQRSSEHQQRTKSSQRAACAGRNTGNVAMMAGIPTVICQVPLSTMLSESGQTRAMSSSAGAYTSHGVPNTTSQLEELIATESKQHHLQTVPTHAAAITTDEINLMCARPQFNYFGPAYQPHIGKWRTGQINFIPQQL